MNGDSDLRGGAEQKARLARVAVILAEMDAIRASTDGCLGGFGILGLLTSMLLSPLGFPAR
jgi:hypothetical protein